MKVFFYAEMQSDHLQTILKDIIFKAKYRLLLSETNTILPIFCHNHHHQIIHGELLPTMLSFPQLFTKILILILFFYMFSCKSTPLSGNQQMSLQLYLIHLPFHPSVFLLSRCSSTLQRQQLSLLSLLLTLS